MAIYDADGNQLYACYDADGNALSYAYDADGNMIYMANDDSDDPYISGRTLLFEDDFTFFDTNNWGFELGRVRNNEYQYYTNNGNNIEITPNNELCIIAKRENYVNATWTSASITSFGKKEFQYGRIEAKLKFPQINGSFPAFWTLGTQLDIHYYADGTWSTHNSGNWAYCGENDIVEQRLGYTDQVTCGAFYSQVDQPNITPVQAGRVNKAIDLSQYHIYACEWTETEMIYYIDGVEWSRFTITDAMAASFRNPHYILIDFAVGGYGHSDPAASVTEMKVYVDWVRVYAPLGS